VGKPQFTIDSYGNRIKGLEGTPLIVIADAADRDTERVVIGPIIAGSFIEQRDFEWDRGRLTHQRADEISAFVSAITYSYLVRMFGLCPTPLLDAGD
jgi:hypothetical protein